MKEAIDLIGKRLKTAAMKTLGDRLTDVEPQVVSASNPIFGDFQCNLAMTLSKELKQAPRLIAEQIVGNMETISTLVKTSLKTGRTKCLGLSVSPL